eukprot:4289300-Prymnesium_polylepis.1
MALRASDPDVGNDAELAAADRQQAELEAEAASGGDLDLDNRSGFSEEEMSDEEEVEVFGERGVLSSRLGSMPRDS